MFLKKLFFLVTFIISFSVFTSEEKAKKPIMIETIKFKELTEFDASNSVSSLNLIVSIIMGFLAFSSDVNTEKLMIKVTKKNNFFKNISLSILNYQRYESIGLYCMVKAFINDLKRVC